MRVDAVVIGGGPAGLTAAAELARRGANVAVLDENPVFGGKLLGQLHESPDGHWWKGWEVAEGLEREAREAGAALRGNASVWALEPGWRVHVADALNRPGQPAVYQAEVVLVATGACEKPVAFPGWTLPGVMTVGAAQVSTNVHRVLPGGRVLVAGIDPLALTVARQLALAGARVAGVFLPPPLPTNGAAGDVRSTLARLSSLARLAPTPWLRLAAGALNSGLVRELAARVDVPGGVRVWGVPVFHRTALIEAVGDGRVERAAVAPVGPDGEPVARLARWVEVDAVCLSGGLAPLAELPATLGCALASEERLGGEVPLHGPELEASRPGVYVAGDVTGVEGAEVAMAKGRLAGLAMSRRLGLGVTDAELRAARDGLERARREAKIEFYPGAREAHADLAARWRQTAAAAAR